MINPKIMSIKITECPRDAMQGIDNFIPTEIKISYINSLLKVGFDTIDFGSFVSPKSIPQMKDTEEVLQSLELKNSNSKLLAIVANLKGALNAIQFKQIHYLGFPFSISPTFQIRNTNSSVEDAFDTLSLIQDLCSTNNKELVVYFSMGFGNPYGDPWNKEMLKYWSEKIHKIGVKTIALSDTIGIATPESITYSFTELIKEFPEVEFGAHFHTTPDTWFEKVDAAYKSGCNRFDGALKGWGGCPMATDKLTGNMPTENLISYFRTNNINLNLDINAFKNALELSSSVFGESKH
jgi:hydroxymethylglutaryl-CoA lyase